MAVQFAQIGPPSSILKRLSAFGVEPWVEEAVGKVQKLSSARFVSVFVKDGRVNVQEAKASNGK